MVVGLLGILKAGAAYVPLDPSYPAERLAYMISDAKPCWCSPRGRRQALPVVAAAPEAAGRGDDAGIATGVPLIDLEADAHYGPLSPTVILIFRRPASRQATQPMSSTRQAPPAAQGGHGRASNVQRLFSATDNWFRFGPDDVWTLFHSLAFDFSVWEIWGALLYGGRLVVVPQLVSRSPTSSIGCCAGRG